MRHEGSLNGALARWLADGRTCIGQLKIDAAPGGGFVVMHRDNAAGPREELEPNVASEDAARIAQFDDAGAYRPLKTAPNLRHGWRLEVADLPALRLALDLFYPGRLAAFLALEEGRLPLTPLRATLGRQTGMYRVTQKLTDAQADELAARFCCSDGGCLRTILWSRDTTGAPASRRLPVAKFYPDHDQTGGGARTIPLLCQEACNLFVAEARKVVKAARPAAQAGSV